MRMCYKYFDKGPIPIPKKNIRQAGIEISAGTRPRSPVRRPDGSKVTHSDLNPMPDTNPTPTYNYEKTIL